MNTTTAPRHLSRDDLLIALVDPSDLSSHQAGHLKDCPVCRQELDRIALRYDRMGKLAAKLTPAPARPIRITERRSSASRYRWRPLMAAAVTGAVIVLMTTLWPRNPDQPTTPSLPQNALTDRELMLEIDALVDNALPPAVQRLAAVATPQFDEDLINWIVPSIQEDKDML